MYGTTPCMRCIATHHVGIIHVQPLESPDFCSFKEGPTIFLLSGLRIYVYL